MLAALDSNIRNLTESEKKRYELLQTMSEQERAHVYESDSRFLAFTDGAPVDPLGFEQSAWKRSYLELVRNKRFIKCMEHKHDYIEILYVYSGRIINVIDGKHVVVCAGEVLLLDTNVTHAVLPANMEDIGFNLVIHKEVFDAQFGKMLSHNDIISKFVVDSIYARKKEKRYLLFETSQCESVRGIMESMIAEWIQQENGYDTAMQGWSLLLFAQLVRHYEKNHQVSKCPEMKRQFVENLQAYLLENYQIADLKSTACYFNFNSDYFGRLVKKQTGINFTSYLQNIKLQQSCILLKNTDLSIDEIAAEVGYADVSYYYRVFRKKYQKTPVEFRETAQKK